MQAYRADWVVRILTSVVSFVYYGAWAALALMFIVVPAMRNLTPDLMSDPRTLSMVPVSLPELGPAAVAQWDVGPRDIELWDVTAGLVQPTSQLPVWFERVSTLGLLVVMGLVLLFLHNLRALFRRVREGAPFDADSAVRMRWLGVWLLAFHVFEGAWELWISWFVARELASSGIPVGPALDINWFAVGCALVLVGLGEVFRRGTELEEEQSLVV